MKYDFDLALDQNTSTGKVIKYVKDGAKVLEFGPGNGRVTKYLKETKHCEVSIIEFDKELYDAVIKFAVDGFLGNIEDFCWCDYFKGQLFDVVIFADVLEHLQDPLKVLENTKLYLKDDGIILVSFPNIGHNSVLIDLFNNKFHYNEYGILDKTHNKFYTQASFETLFKQTGLYIEAEDYTYAQVNNKEFDNTYDALPVEIQYDVKIRPFGEVYQYFFVLSQKPNDFFKPKLPDNSNAVVQLNLVYDYGNDVKVEPWLLNVLTGENQKILLNLSDELKALKIVPMQEKGILEFRAMLGKEKITALSTNAIWQIEDSYVFLNSQPFFRIEGEHIKGKEIELFFKFRHLGSYSELQRKILIDSYKNKRDNLDLNKKLDAVSSKLDTVTKKSVQKIEIMRKRYAEVTNSRLWRSMDGIRNISNLYKRKKQLVEKKNNFFEYNIDAFEFDYEKNKILITGWGFDNSDHKNLNYDIPAEEGAYYKVFRQDRVDVCDVFDLDRTCKPGFLIQIEGGRLKRNYNLILKTKTGIKLLVKIDRLNLEEKSFIQKTKDTLKSVKKLGVQESYKKFSFKKAHPNSDDYDYWIYKNERIDFQEQKKAMDAFKIKPLISVIVPVYNVEDKWLRKCIDSLKKQIYEHWELCIADDCSTKAYVQPLLEELAQKDNRIKLVFRSENGHISKATNSAIKIATGDFIGFMDNDDELAPLALYEIAKAINDQNDIDFIYTDEDKISIKGKRFDPFFKPDWNPVLLLGHNYITHFVVVKRELFEKVGSLRSEMDGSQDYDFVLRATEQAKKIYHIPKILYHWRTVETSVAFDPQSKEYAYTAGKRALEDSLHRRKLFGSVKMTRNYGAYKINYKYNESPMVSIILWGKGRGIEESINSILTNSDYQNYEILLSMDMQEVLKYGDFKIRITQFDTLEKSVEKARGKYLLFLKDTLILENKHNIKELLNYGLNDKVGIVGGKIITKENIIYNAGAWIDEKNRQIHYAHRGYSNRSLGYYFRIVLPQNVFSVTEDCLLISKKNYTKVNGLNENLASELRGIDLCIKIRSLGLDVIWTPYFIGIEMSEDAELLTKEEFDAFGKIWPIEKRKDPYTNPWIENKEV